MQSPDFDLTQGSLVDLVVQELGRHGVVVTLVNGRIEANDADSVSIALVQFETDFQGSVTLMLEQLDLQQLDIVEDEASGDKAPVLDRGSIARVLTPQLIGFTPSYGNELIVGGFNRFRDRAVG